MTEKETVEATRRTASGSSFYWAMRLLPGEKRRAMYAIYGFCRAVDDIADDVAASDCGRAADLDEDAELGRLYLPREFLDQASIAIDKPLQAIAHPAIDPVCRGLAELAERHYREADRIFRSHPRGDLRPSRLMGAVYSAMLSR